MLYVGKALTVNIIKSTELYELWLTHYTPLVAADVASKHRLMSSGAFPFLRATFYRWIQHWNELAGDLAKAPSVLAVGDIHIENYGTWRDAEGRLVWGINDFDEACFLPYTQDLIRLITSAYLAIKQEHLRVGLDAAGEAVIRGYTEQMAIDGQPFVVAENHDWLRSIAITSLRDPVRFWQKMDALPPVKRQDLPLGALVAIEHMMPAPGLKYKLRRRVAGMGSLGHMRFVAIGEHEGGLVAREAKALVPPAVAWSTGASNSVEILYQVVLDRAVRCHDPLVQLQGQWIVRRLAPDCSKIEMNTLPEERDELHMLKAMGQELANVHLGTPDVRKAILADLKSRGKRKAWFRTGVEAMAAAITEDYLKWRVASGVSLSEDSV